MKGDFSRWYLNGKRNFNGVLHQQGRVLLDSDWNAQTEITNDWQEQAGRDVIGSGVAAIPADKPDGFKVTEAKIDPTDGKVKITVKPGRAWADGLLVYLNEETENKETENKEITISRRATYLQPPIQNPSFDEFTIDKNVRDAVILEVWREEINGFQLPDELIEPALGGPDTTERVHTAIAFRLLRLGAGDTCANIRDKLKDDPSKKGKLKVTLQPTTVISRECPVVEGGGYTGFEHNLYRIEIARVDGDVAMFKWSQFNGGLVGRGKFNASEKKVEITANLQAIITSGLTDFYLEAVEYDKDLGHWKVTYGAEVTLNSDNQIKLPDTTTFGTIPSNSKPVFFRLWNGIEKIADFPKATAPTGPKELRDGIRLEFDDPSTTNYVPGDYWIFPLRAGEIKNNDILINDKSPEGIHYHRVPLAILKWNDAKDISFDKKEIDDCRDIFQPLTRQAVCCTFTVGDGKSSNGDFNSIEEALRHLPDSGGQICLLPGLHETNVLIEERHNIRIRGCDKNTKVIPRESNREVPIFHLKDSRYIILEHMDMVTLGGTAILLEGTDLGKLQEIEIHSNRIQACKNAVHVEKGMGVYIHHNKIQMWDKEEGDVAIYMMAEDSVIERNDISVIPTESATPPADIPIPPDTPNPIDPCADREKIYKKSHFFVNYTNWVFSLQPVFIPPVRQKTLFKSPGGMQIAGGSERIKILENRIAGGSWNGITLGNIPSESEFDDLKKSLQKNHNLSSLSTNRLDALQKKFKGFLYDIIIEENEIRNMGLNGIGVIGFFNIAKIQLFVSVEDLTIYKNHIEYCLQQIPERIPTEMKTEMGFGGISLSDCENLIIRENRIENNGKSHLEPVSGVFILHGEKIDISDNRIFNNGPRASDENKNARPGMRGGIVIGLSFKKALLELFEGKEYLSPDGIPAVKIHDNIVTQPLGQALFIIALGPVSVIGNHLTSQGADFTVNPISSLAGSVFILNLGISKDLIGRLLFSSFRNMASANPSMVAASVDTATARTNISPNIDRVAASVDTATARTNISANTDMVAASVDTAAASTNISANIHRVGEAVDTAAASTNISANIHRVGEAVDTVTARTNISPNIDRVAASVDTATARTNRLQYLYFPSGNVLFSNNQTTLDLRAPEINFALSSQLIASLDDVSYVGNQSECTSILDIVLTDALIFGVTIRTNDNRFQEGFTQALWSLFSYGFMNTCTTNQATHCLHVLGNPAFRVFAGNTVLLTQAVVRGKKVDCEEDFKRLQGHFNIAVKK